MSGVSGFGGGLFEYGKIIPRPTDITAASTGYSITWGASSAYGVVTEIVDGADVTHDVYGIALTFFNGPGSGFNENKKIRIGVDPAAGTSYTTVIDDYLLGEFDSIDQSSIGSYSCFLPIYIKAGGSIGIYGAAAPAAGVFGSFHAQLFCAPTHPDVPVCSKMYTYAVDVATCLGTSITPGTSADGLWTEIGTVAAGTYPRFWQATFITADTVSASLYYSMDVAIGNASNKYVVIEAQFIRGGTQESLMQTYGAPWMAWYQAAPGDIIYAKVSCSGTPDTPVSVGVMGFA